MNDVWLNIKTWTQRLLIAALVLYAGIFIYKNSNQTVPLWFWFKHEKVTTVFVLVAGAFLAGVVFTVLISMIFRTLRQMRDRTSRVRTEKIERDIAEMKTKAAMLQTRPTTVTATPTGEGVTVQVDRLGQ